MAIPLSPLGSNLGAPLTAIGRQLPDAANSRSRPTTDTGECQQQGSTKSRSGVVIERRSVAVACVVVEDDLWERRGKLAEYT